MNAILNPHVRVGKIARLPDHIREELNHHLCNNEMGLRLLDWLNSLPEVQAILARNFGGRPINSVNLTKWKLGGYREWVFRREIILTTLEAKKGISNRPVREIPALKQDLQMLAASRMLLSAQNAVPAAPATDGLLADDDAIASRSGQNSDLNQAKIRLESGKSNYF